MDAVRRFPDIAFLNHMAITFVVIVAVMAFITAIRPLPEPVRLPVVEGIDTTPSLGAKRWGMAIVVVTIALYVLFW